ncbi:MAG TPA: O-antigen ligase family protein [Acidimicrobiales bacterium]|nr:O-antigen ligase family protein [Acidimicrobiales bacterium]
MPEPLVAATILCVAAILVGAPIRWALGVLVFATLLVPDSLVLPYAPSGYFNAQRIFLVAFLIRMLVGHWRREVPTDAFRVTPLHIALVAFAAVTYVVGVLLARFPVAPDDAFNSWLLVVDQVVFVVVVVAAIRTISDPLSVASALIGAIGVAAVIALWEHVSHDAYSVVVWFRNLPDQAGFPGARPIEVRGGDVRVRAAAGFSLSFAWIAGGLIPLALVVASWRRRWWLLVAPVVGLAVLWTYSRSVLAGLAVGVVVLVVASRFEGRVTRIVLVLGVAAALLLGMSSMLGRTFDERAAEGSNTVREERLPVVLDLAADRPLVGAGHGAVRSQGFAGTDATYVSTYVELGVVGLISLMALLATALWVTLPALRSPLRRDRAVAAATVAGVVMAIMGAGAFDLFPSVHSSRPFWALVCLGLVLTEHTGTAWSLRLPSGRLFVGAAAGLLAGFGALALAPRSDTATYRFQSLGVASDARADVPRDFIGRVRLLAACDAADAVGGRVDADVYCGPVPNAIDLADLRIAIDSDRGTRALDDAVDAIHGGIEAVVPDPELVSTGRFDDARPAWASTAMMWMPIVTGGIAVGLPDRRRRR